MELKVSSHKSEGLSPPYCVNDPEEKEVSDDDDDDRNHKHRRRDTRSQSFERDPLEHILSRPYRKRNRNFENGNVFRENESQASESWKSYNASPLERDFSAKFDKRRSGLTPLPRAPLDLNQRTRGNQSYPGDHGLGRGRGRESGSWNQRDSRFSSGDIGSQMFQQGSIPNLYAGRGMKNVSNAQSAPWSAFGLVPGIPNGGLDTIHSIGMQGTIAPPINHPLNMGITRQRCRDFEERGFCLRGDMCPMEHGVNRIVIEDVQSLSQFNLPVSLPSAHLLGTQGGLGSLPSDGAPSSTLMNSKGLNVKSNKPGMAGDGLGLNGSYSSTMAVSATDLYDPDQPLWNNDGPETSTGLLGLNSFNIDETESLVNNDPSDHHVRLSDTVYNESQVRNTNPNIWGRISGSKNASDVTEKIDSIVSSSDLLENETKQDQVILAGTPSTARQGRRIVEDTGPIAMDSSQKAQISMRNNRKPSQKALRTLFVNGIPQNNNKKEALLSHFQKFGEVIDIYIPSNSERAFIQFSRREDAEAALKAPDAVMGNRFIKLWWANRDSIPDSSITSGSSISRTPHGTSAASGTTPPIANMGEESFQDGAIKGGIDHTPAASVPASDHPKPIITNGPKVPPPLQKQLEELRKKQELLDQKRNEFRRQLEQKLQKQATGLKGEVVAEHVTKIPKVGVATDAAKSAGMWSADTSTAVGSPRVEVMADKNKSVSNVLSHSPKANTVPMLQQSMSSKQLLYPSAPIGAPFLMNRYKLDNRPTAFIINPPLPAGFANVSVLEEHFSPFGELSAVELVDPEVNDGGNGLETSQNCSVRITFTNRRSAEWAFVEGNYWEGHTLKFTWLTSSRSINNLRGKENSHSAPKNIQSQKLASSVASGNVEAGLDMQYRECSQPSQTAPIAEDKESPSGTSVEDGPVV